MKNFPLLVAFILLALFLFASCRNPSAQAVQSADELSAAGSQPDDPGPLASDLSPRLKRRDILKAVRKVADWQLQEADGKYNVQWTYAVLYNGFLVSLLEPKC